MRKAQFPCVIASKSTVLKHFIQRKLGAYPKCLRKCHCKGALFSDCGNLPICRNYLQIGLGVYLFIRSPIRLCPVIIFAGRGNLNTNSENGIILSIQKNQIKGNLILKFYLPFKTYRNMKIIYIIY